jgi:L-seryl-tRNA(Ser) seleniumtransferase
MKVGKEEMMGCLAAVEAWMKKDLNALDREWNARVKRIAKLVETVPGVTTDIQIPRGGNRYPTLTVKWDEQAFGLTVAECAKRLRDGEPRIEVLTASNPSLVPAVHEGDPKGGSKSERPQRPDQLRIVSMTLQPGEEMLVGRRLREILNGARKAGERGAPTA